MRVPKWAQWIIRNVGIVIAAIVAVVAFNQYVDSRLEKAVTNEEFLGRLSKKVRPSLIFNSKGAVESDLGASEYIQEIEVKRAPESYGYRVNVKLTKPLAFPPLIRGVNLFLLAQESDRTTMHDWTFLMAPNTPLPGILGDGNRELETNGVVRFHLEILH